jgi:hypothetical protein
VTGVSSLTALALNTLTINGNTGYFANPAWLGRCLKITAIVGNACGSSTDFTYLNFNGMYFDDPGTGSRGSATVGEGSGSVEGLLAYPNPFSGALTVGFDLTRAMPVTLVVVDATGREVSRPLQAQPLAEGPHSFQIEATGWPAGLYGLRLTTAIGTTASSIVKINP